MIVDVEFIQKVNNRLSNLGYLVTNEDSGDIEYLSKKMFNRVTNQCNIKEVHNDLEYTIIDMICGEFLFERKQTGKLEGHFNLETAISSIKIGDTDIKYSNESDEKKLDKLISHLMFAGEDELKCYRKIKW